MHKVIAKVDHDKLIPFLKEHLKFNSGWAFFYWFFNLLFIGYTFYYCFSKSASLDTIVSGLGLGFAFFFLLLPIHEGIHGIAYKIMGAPKVSFGGNWRKGIAYAVADQFAIGYKAFLFVALTPFIIINSVLILILIFNSSANNLLILGILILHTAGCFGDFALVNFMHLYRHLHIMTMDNMEEKATYFYEGA